MSLKDFRFFLITVAIIMPITENFDILPTNVEYPYFDVYKSPIYGLIFLHHVCTYGDSMCLSSFVVWYSIKILFNYLNNFQIYYKPATCIIDGAMDTILAAFVASASKNLLFIMLK